MGDQNKLKELDPTKIIAEMREEYWREISKPVAEAEEKRETLLVVESGGERFALSAPQCKIVLRAGRITRIPRLPPHMLGVINLRGEILSVVDLGLLLGLPPTSRETKARLVAAEAAGLRAAFLVEQVHGIEEIELSRLREPQSLETTVKSEYIKAHIAPVGEEPWITWLDLDRVLQSPELSARRK